MFPSRAEEKASDPKRQKIYTYKKLFHWAEKQQQQKIITIQNGMKHSICIEEQREAGIFSPWYQRNSLKKK